MGRRDKNGNGDGSSRAIDSILFKLFTRLIVSLVVILVFLTLVQCTIKKPESPVWTTNFVLPLVNKTYDMEEIIRRIDQDGIAMDSMGNITYTITKQLDTVRIGSEHLATPNLTYSFGQVLDTVSISTPIIPPVFVGLSTITGISASTPEDTVTVAQQSFNINSNLPIPSSYTTATIYSGTANVNLFNNLGAALDTVLLELRDLQFGTIIAADSFYNVIPSGTTAAIPVDLSGRTISSRFRVNAYCHTTGGFVTQVSTRGISTELDFVGKVTVTSAVAEIPALSRSFSDQVNLLETDRVDTASIASGNLSISINNASNLNVNVSITLPDFLLGGQPLTLAPNILPRQISNLNINVSGYDIIPSDASVPQTLNINAIAYIPPTAPSHVSVTASDSFAVSASLSGLTFNSVSGYFDSVDASFNGISQTIDVPTGFDSVQFPSAILTLEVTNSIDLPGDLDIQVDGDNGKNLNLAGAISASGALASATSTIVEPSAGDFLSPIPSQFDVSGSVVFANGGYQGRVEANDYISATVTLTSPLEMVIQASQVQTDIEKTKIDQSDIDAVTDHVLEAKFVYNIVSHLPIDAQVDIFFGPDSATLFSSPQLIVNAIQLPAAPTGIGGIVTDTISTGYLEVLLDSIDIKILDNDTLYIASALNLAGTGGQMVKLTGSDYLQISGRVEVNYRFDGEF
ncbi:MAG TPA: hypothetical protein VHP63_07130 [candidate division Zixibacteria bacterium]|nr:hypothetical protein [candidate division Zixibacteria bacterium]